MREIEARVRFLERAMLGVCLVVICGFVLGATNDAPEEIRARRFVVVSEGGGEAARLDADISRGRLALLDAKGTRVVLLQSGATSGGELFLMQHSDKLGFQVIADSDGTDVLVGNSSGRQL